MKMDYCVLGTNNMEASIKFYNSLFEQTELNQVLSTERMTFWQGEGFAFAIAKPFNEELASNGNGTMIALLAETRSMVDKFHSVALENGGVNEGLPGLRHDNNYYAYIRDLDGNKICAYSISEI